MRSNSAESYQWSVVGNLTWYRVAGESGISRKTSTRNDRYSIPAAKVIAVEDQGTRYIGASGIEMSR